mgnify:CR=1 FL=1
MREMQKVQMIFLFISLSDMVRFAAIYRQPNLKADEKRNPPVSVGEFMKVPK